MGCAGVEVVEKRDQILARWSRKAGRLTETLALCMDMLQHEGTLNAQHSIRVRFNKFLSSDMKTLVFSINLSANFVWVEVIAKAVSKL